MKNFTCRASQQLVACVCVCVCLCLSVVGVSVPSFSASDWLHWSRDKGSKCGEHMFSKRGEQSILTKPIMVNF